MHFYNSSTRNCDHHILLIMTGNAHKESCHKLSLILVREHELYMIKTDCSGKMVIAFTIKENNHLVISLFCHLMLPLSYLYLWYIKFLIWLHNWSYFRHCGKSCYCSLYIQFYKLLWLWFYVDYLLNLGFYHDAVKYRRKYLNSLSSDGNSSHIL